MASEDELDLDLERALALSMQEVTTADLTSDDAQRSDSAGSRKRALSADEEDSAATRKRSYDLSLRDAGGNFSSSADASGADDSKHASGALLTAARQDTDNVDENASEEPAVSEANPGLPDTSTPPPEPQIDVEAIAEAMARAFAEMRSAQHHTQAHSVLASQTQSNQPSATISLPLPPNSLPQQSQPQSDPSVGVQEWPAAQQQAMAAAMGPNQSSTVADFSIDAESTEASAAAKPAWAQRLACFWEHPSSILPRELPLQAPIAMPSSEVEDVRSALQSALGLPVRFLGSTYSAPAALASTAPVALAITISLSAIASDFVLTGAALDAAVRSRVSGSRLRKQRQTEIAALAAVHFRSAEPPTASASVQTALQVLRSSVCRRMVTTLAASDTEDLYFKEGEHAEQLLQCLANHQVGPACLAEMLSNTTFNDLSGWEGVLRAAFSAFVNWEFAPMTLEPALSALDQLTRPPLLQALLVYNLMLSLEVPNGAQLETICILSPILAVGSVPDVESVLHNNLQSPAAASFTGLRNYPAARGEADGATASIRAGLDRVQSVTKEIAKRVIKFKGFTQTEPEFNYGQEVLMAWLAGVGALNFVRTTGGEVGGVLGLQQLSEGSSDRFALGAAALGLRLCRPFLAGDPKHMCRLEPTYYSTAAYRLCTPTKLTTLVAIHGASCMVNSGDSVPRATSGADAGDCLMHDTKRADTGNGPQWEGYPFLTPHLPASHAVDATSPHPPHLVADCFFITAQLMSTCVIPAMNRYEHLLEAQQRKQKKAGEGAGKDLVAGHPPDLWLLMDTSSAQLTDPGFAGDAVQFAVLQIKWLYSISLRPDARQAMSLIPDNVPKDAASWLQFCVRMGCADLVSGSDVGGLVEGVVGLLECPLITSPLVADKLVSLLLVMLSSDKTYSRHTTSAAASRALKLAVLGTGAAQLHLLPALMRVYAAADAVVGLDVDRDSFDKFSMRHNIDLLLLEIWMDPAQKTALSHLAQEAAAAPETRGGAEGHRALLVEYARALLNSLMYMLGDSLERLFDVHVIESAQEDDPKWQALPKEERERKLQFAEYQRGLGGSYMRTAVTTLQLLLEIVSDDDVVAAFTAPSLVPLAAFASLHFLELLVGTKAAGLRIQDPQKIGFDPVNLSVLMAELLLHLSRSPVFVDAIAAEQDYREAVLQELYDRVVRGELGNHAHASGLASLMKQVRKIRSKEVVSKPPGMTSAATAADSYGMVLSETTFAEPEVADVQEAYVEALQEIQRCDFDSTKAGAYSSLYAGMAEANPGDTAGKMRRLQRELRNLATRTPLPLDQAAAIFLRYDMERIDKMRAILTGPEDTPYEGGLFVFDLFFPPQYPFMPPSMKLETTGNGIARFNPNLYADGKVCLSLLGTFSSGGATERWNSQTSSLFQVLVSIQGMILVDDPYFNEPSVEKMRATAEGEATSAQYNLGVQLNTMRWAMIAHLKRPPPGFEDVVKAHFLLLRWRIMRTAAKWLSTASQLSGVDEVLLQRMRSTVSELHTLLAAL